MLTLDAIRPCLEGAIPGNLATCAPDGTPNVSYLSQVEYVDSQHVALSFQFFNKTHENILANPWATLVVVHPLTAARYRLSMRYLRTETSGPLFERMKAKLAGIASHFGVSDVFRLRGSDVYRVQHIEALPGATLVEPPAQRSLLSALRRSTERLAACSELAALLETALAALADHFDIQHSLVLLLDGSGECLYSVASRGYEASGIGSEIPVGQGVIGVAARERTPIRIGHMTSEYSYSRAVRASAMQGGMDSLLETEIPLPGLPESRSQIAVPIPAGQRLLGVLYAESPQDLRFGYDEEDALVAFAAQLGLGMHILREQDDGDEEVLSVRAPAQQLGGTPVILRRYGENDSVFLDGDYLIRGVAGSILWSLAQDYVLRGRSEFTNRELRLDPRIRLPDVSDNLEARLILLQRRLEERRACVRIEKTGRGRFRLCVSRPLELLDVGHAAG